MHDKMGSFARAFTMHSGGCRRTCDCGKVYYDDSQSYDWEPGELEWLQNGPGVAVDGGPSDIGFEGKQFVEQCDCWHERAQKLMQFIDGHARQIAEYLTREKVRKVAEAKASPVVCDFATES